MMSAIAVTSAANHRRIRRARAWLEGRVLAEEVLIVGASLDAANELPRSVAEEKGRLMRSAQPSSKAPSHALLWRHVRQFSG
jgi:hypothetical protein